MNIQYTKENNYMRISNKGIALILLAGSEPLTMLFGVAYCYFAAVAALTGLIFCAKGYKEL